MKKLTLCCLVMLAISLLAGCTSKARLYPVAEENQNVVYHDGKPMVYSNRENFVALALPEVIELGERVRGYVQVQNRVPSSFEFSPNEIKVYEFLAGEEASTGKHVFTYDELVAEEERRQMWKSIAAIWVSAANAANANNAGWSNTYGSYGGNVYNNYGGYGSFSGAYSSTTYDASKAYMARAQANRENAELEEKLQRENEAAMYALSRDILKRNTVLPGAICGGLIEVEEFDVGDTSKRVEFVIDAGSERHTIKYTLEKMK